MISDDALRRMTGEERASLSRRLAALDSDLPPLSAGDERRRRFVIVLTVASVGLVPWIVLLALTLPHRYLAGHWTLTWVGFDIFLLSGLALTAWLACRAPAAGGRDQRVHHWCAPRLRRLVRHHDRLGTHRHDHRGRVGPGSRIASRGTAFRGGGPHLLRLTVRRAHAADGRGTAPCRLLREPLFGVAGGSPT